ncbi:hypothetical protein EZJ43_00990 [Pedobacter changchengzhani]|uniref:Uncharacterized protein n=1 Tax=Pedobacter changchengzhani TaxID=2529274 RepID=A0A4R5MPC2_9SPHI|nr:hypothetical protein [Pedobacter changchengzhani]TDG37700.1 hypothetical protein EZJ43_00990 [Pedobacter changchengzhani]
MISSIKKYFIRKTYDVIFYYPQHFNRNENGENPYFEKLISSCVKNNFSYLLLEEPDRGTKYPRSKKATKFDFWFYLIIIFKKIIPSSLFKNYLAKELSIAKVISLLSLNRFKANTYITISNAKINFLSGLNSRANVFDLQHGVIYSWHPGYFNRDFSLHQLLRPKKINFLVSGTSFKHVFCINEDFCNYKTSDSVSVIGNVLSEDITYSKRKFSSILYTLQITDDLTTKEIDDEKIELVSFIKSIASFFIENKLSLILKNHPRFNDDFFLNSLQGKFFFVEISKKNMNDVASEIFLHLTKSSTSIFELAQRGIPSLLVQNEVGSKIFIDEYKYPIKTSDICKQTNEYLQNRIRYMEDQKRVIEWVSGFYEPYNEEAFIEILTQT